MALALILHNSIAHIVYGAVCVYQSLDEWLSAGKDVNPSFPDSQSLFSVSLSLAHPSLGISAPLLKLLPGLSLVIAGSRRKVFCLAAGKYRSQIIELFAGYCIFRCFS